MTLHFTLHDNSGLGLFLEVKTLPLNERPTACWFYSRSYYSHYLPESCCRRAVRGTDYSIRFDVQSQVSDSHRPWFGAVRECRATLEHLFYLCQNICVSKSLSLSLKLEEHKRWNPILTWGFLELVVLWSVICRQIHIPVRTAKWPPHLIVPIASTFLFSYLILYITQWTSAKEFLNWDKMLFFEIISENV